ncbi:hypothetical protein [Propionivibrio soli]|jgi:hypothetical protein|nr:hypothetical protein [Propionivibrio soli]
MELKQLGYAVVLVAMALIPQLISAYVDSRSRSSRGSEAQS